MKLKKTIYSFGLVIALFIAFLSTGTFAQEEGVNVYRVYNPQTGEHLYTADEAEAMILVQKTPFEDEGVAWIAPLDPTRNPTGQVGSEPVFRLYSPVTGEHLYSMDLNEVNTLVNSGAWVLDNDSAPAFYAGGDVPIYRLYNPVSRQHHLTTDVNEYNTLASRGWNQEGVAFYAKALSDLKHFV